MARKVSAPASRWGTWRTPGRITASTGHWHSSLAVSTLPQRAVLVVLALDDQHGHADIGEFHDVPFAELLVEPGAAPAVERIVGIPVPACELGAQVAGSRDRACEAISATPNASVKNAARSARGRRCDGPGCRHRSPRSRRRRCGEQDAALEPDRIEHDGGTSRPSSCMKLVRRWHHRGAGAPIAGAGIGEHAEPARRCEAVGKSPAGRPSRGLHGAGRRSRLRPAALRSSVFQAARTDLLRSLPRPRPLLHVSVHLRLLPSSPSPRLRGESG
jgi:hypothetical protein